MIAELRNRLVINRYLVTTGPQLRQVACPAVNGMIMRKREAGTTVWADPDVPARAVEEARYLAGLLSRADETAAEANGLGQSC
jgi:hypothetical protein